MIAKRIASKPATVSLLDSIEQHFLNQDMTNTTFDLEDHLTKIVSEFEFDKAQMSAFDRRQLRNRFIQLGKINAGRLNETMQLLAEQAVASPSRKSLYNCSIRLIRYCFFSYSYRYRSIID